MKRFDWPDGSPNLCRFGQRCTTYVGSDDGQLLGATITENAEPPKRRAESATRYHAEHVVGGGKINRQRGEGVPVQARFGELDHVLVTMRGSALD
jgi:hypothetical protein